MTDNASTNVVAPKGTTGFAGPIVGNIDQKGLTDTYMGEMDEGTVTSGGANG